jgi:hypothetical protein
VRIALVTLGLIFTISAYSQNAANQHPLVGTWKLISFQEVSKDGETRAVFGQHPKGYLILTPERRFMVLGTSETRTAGVSDAERAELEKSMFAYTGKYRIEGGDVVISVDVSSNESWNGTERRRHYQLQANRLTLVNLSVLSPITGKVITGVLVWEREK